ncbi:vitelline membrane outer layer protein 1-like [Colossoma macropomum]|uniref:vitelline membrane outer layer protein 1-like n=1 Tax=Colossoma macropomum TaxID=42526 RepID=UPI001863DBAC|nr:vitelline membrane outer layer protein 1-like [Colossoma macropomum]
MNQLISIILPLLLLSFGVQIRGQSAAGNTNKTRSLDRPYLGIITVGNGQIWGSWGNREMCPLGTYATGFSLKVESNQGFWGDDTALNGIALRCTPPNKPSNAIINYSTVQSNSGSWGQWTQNKWCTNGQLVAFQLRVEPKQGFGDDSAANNIRFRCSGGDVWEGDGMGWGSWGSWSPTCAGRGICGIETKVEAPQGPGDDTSLNDVRFYCCS